MAIDKVNFTSVIGSVGKKAPGLKNEAYRYKANEELQKELLTLMPKPVQFLKKMSTFVGEVPNIIINAVGTGLVAPFFIRYNFLSKTDEDTRTYSAMRQPLSAVLAILIQAGVVIPIDRVIDKNNNTGNCALKYDKSGCQDLSHIKRDIKKANPGMDKIQIAKLAQEKQLEQMQGLIDSVNKSGKIEFMSGGKKVAATDDMMRRVLNQTTDDLIKHFDLNLKRYDGEQVEKQLKRGDYLRTNKTDVKNLLNEIDAKVKSTPNEKDLLKWLGTKSKEMKKANTHPELLGIVEDIHNRANIETIKEKLVDINSKTDFYSTCKSKDDVVKKIMEKINTKKAHFTEEKGIVLDIKKLIAEKKPVTEILKEAKKLEAIQKMRNVSHSDFVYDVVQKYIKNVSKNVGAKKQIFAIIVGLITLPITASLLNKIYPPFMDKFFPELSKNKKAKSADQFVNTANLQRTAVPASDEKKSGEVRK